uniref:Uncharacterized protein n=1 Tax=Panulirus argus virus 1 TaxID=380624 RepID=A0A6G9HDX3_9VIRU|nr:hypothetical protein [Panulirus argus virus 1]
MGKRRGLPRSVIKAFDEIVKMFPVFKENVEFSNAILQLLLNEMDDDDDDGGE